ncbi:hypothetical protein Ddye_003941 [Dipteronia dyeriana]|uniref:Knottins-like domain-containing protein n=1 Tax=Dipteronia dyeriana TaxID=168575 RepID=A0AAE0CVS5_9ROSI|nr:hypothetical protein Ddye_003941 [Dipteronia dyeriana]
MMMTTVEANICERPSQTWSGNCGNTGHCDKQCKDWEHASHGACHKRENHWKCFCYFECKKPENHEQKKTAINGIAVLESPAVVEGELCFSRYLDWRNRWFQRVPPGAGKMDSIGFFSRYEPVAEVCRWVEHRGPLVKCVKYVQQFPVKAIGLRLQWIHGT